MARATHTDPATPLNVQPLGSTGWGDPVFSEEFNGGVEVVSGGEDSTIRFRDGGPTWATQYPAWSRFEEQVPGGNHTNTDQAAYYTLDQVGTAAGSLNLSAEKTITNGMAYKAGMIQSIESFTPHFGFFEARIRLDAVPQGVWGAWWMSNAVTNTWPPEIDVAEFFDSGTGVVANVFMPAIPLRETQIGPASIALNWHTYGVKWTATEVTFYLDGNVVGTQTEDIPDVPQYLILNHGARTPNLPTFDSGLMEVDYVRAWAVDGQTAAPSSDLQTFTGQPLALKIIKDGVLVPVTLNAHDGTASELTTFSIDPTSAPAPRWAPA